MIECSEETEFLQETRSLSSPLPSISLPLRRFLIVEKCPADWQHFDLYLMRDESIVFYVGQSHSAFHRVWSHIFDGFKGRSLLGRFVLMNWPRALRFVVELHHSQSETFQPVAYNLNRAEQRLIAAYHPCFNNTHNPNPAPLPAHFNPPTVEVRHPRNPKSMIREAGLANQQIEQSDPTIWNP